MASSRTCRSSREGWNPKSKSASVLEGEVSEVRAGLEVALLARFALNVQQAYEGGEVGQLLGHVGVGVVEAGSAGRSPSSFSNSSARARRRALPIVPHSRQLLVEGQRPVLYLGACWMPRSRRWGRGICRDRPA